MFNILKTAIIKSINLLGYDLKKRPRERRATKKPKKSIFIEFIGPAGIGKTTLFNEIAGKTTGDWFHKGQNKSSIISKNADKVDGGTHWKLLYNKAKNLEERNLNGYRKIKLMKYFTNVAFNDFNMRHNEFKKGFLLEEGLCHNFSKEINKLSETEFRHLMSSRALIYLMPRDSMTVVQRIHKRKREEGRIVTHHIGLNDWALKEIAENSVKSFNRLIERAEKLGIPCCRIFAENPTSKNAETILAFEKQIISPKSNYINK